MLSCPTCHSGRVARRGWAESGRDRLRIHCRACGRYATVDYQQPSEESHRLTDVQAREVESEDGYLITSVQNNTPIREGLLRSMQRCAEDQGLRLLVVRVRYRNPTSPDEARVRDAEVWWPRQVREYMIQNDLRIHPKLVVMGDFPIEATAVNPLSGLGPLTGASSAIFGHGQVQMTTIPTPQQDLPKILHTTGSLSIKNYSRSKRGKRGAFHHTHGGLIVKKRGGAFHIRQTIADDRDGFFDGRSYYHPDGITVVDHVEALVVGDEHVMFMDPSVRCATYEGADSIVGVLRPLKIVRHDVVDAYSVSHHHRRDPVIQYVKWRDGITLERELLQVVDHIDSTTPVYAENVIVASNHHEHIGRWLREADPKAEPWNAVLYHQMMAELLETARMGDGGVEAVDPFAVWCGRRLKSRTTFLARGESHMIANVEVSMHGDVGPNGARGSRRNLSMIGVRSMIGHSHSPGIEKGCDQVGCCNYPRDYERGSPSSHLHTHGVIHLNGKRQLISVIDGDHGL